MDNKKNDKYYLFNIVEDGKFILKNTDGMTEDDIKNNAILVDSIMFRFVMISESVTKLSDDFKDAHSNIPWKDIKGMRNRIVHNYGSVDFGIVYSSIKN